MAFRVDISRPALLDAENIFVWITADSEERCHTWLTGLITATDSLSEFPNRCPIAPESRSFLIEVRHLLYGKGKQQCRIIFGVSVDENTGEDIVLIYRVRRASQSYLTGLEILGESYDE